VVVIIGGLLSGDPNDVPDDTLLPFDESELNYYVAIVSTAANSSHTLGNGVTTSINSVDYYDQPLSSNKKYTAFVRVYSAHVCYISAYITTTKYVLSL